MKLKFELDEKKSSAKVGEKYNEVFLAKCYTDNDRLLFVQDGQLVMGLNLTKSGSFIMQVHNDLHLYMNLKRVSKLEVKALLEE